MEIKGIVSDILNTCGYEYADNDEITGRAYAILTKLILDSNPNIVAPFATISTLTVTDNVATCPADIRDLWQISNVETGQVYDRLSIKDFVNTTNPHYQPSIINPILYKLSDLTVTFKVLSGTTLTSVNLFYFRDLKLDENKDVMLTDGLYSQIITACATALKGELNG